MALILVVDDHPTDRELLVTLLGYAGHQLLQAGDGAQALALVEASPPDLILSDVLMPTMDGVAFVNRLLANPRFRAIPVIFITASYRMAEAQALADACGAMRVLPKPCQPQLIFDAVHAALGLARFVPAASAAGGRPPELPAGRPHDLHGLNARIAAIVARGTQLVQRQGPIQHATGELSVILGRLEEVSLRLSALLETGLDLAKERDPQKLLELFCRAAQDVVSARFGVLGILGEGGLRRLVTRGLPALTLEAMPPAPDFLRRLMRDGRSRRVADCGPDAAPWGLPAGTPPLGSLLAVPLVSARRAHGWLYLADRIGAEAFSEEDESLAATLAIQTVLAYENLQLVEALQAEVLQRTRAEEASIRLLEIVESSEDAIITLDRELKITEWNKGAEQILGYRGEDVRGQPYAVLVPAGLRAEYQAKADSMLRGRMLPMYETSRLRADGEQVQVAIQSTLNRDVQGGITGITVILRDISSRRRVEESLRDTATKLQNVFNSIDEVIWSMDGPTRVLIAISPACEKIYGHPPAAFLSNPGLWFEQIHPDDRPQALEALAQLERGQAFELQRRILHPNGQLRWLRVKGKPFLDPSGRLVRVDGTASDITEALAIQERLAQQERLADLGTLVGTVAHDLRNPLTGIVLNLERLEPLLEAAPATQPILGCLRKGVGRISDLVGELLEFAHPRPLDLRPWDLAEVVRQVVEDCGYLAEEGGCQVAVQFGPGPCRLELDGARMHQVLKNLLENAIQHSPRGGQVLIRGRAEADGAFLLTVEDQGGGIASADLLRIFDPFFTRRQGGTGLGLAICRRIVEQHQGAIWAQNLAQGGAVLALRLPVPDQKV